MAILAQSLATSTIVVGKFLSGWEANLLGWGLSLLGLFFVLSQPELATHEGLRRWVGFITLGAVFGLLGVLFWPATGLVFTLAQRPDLITPYSSLWYGLQYLFIWIGFLVTELFLIGLRLARQGPYSTGIVSKRIWVWLIPIFLLNLFPSVYYDQWLGLLPSPGAGILFMLCFGGAGGCLAPVFLPQGRWEQRIYHQGWLALFGGVLFTLGIIVLSSPAFVLL